LLRRATLDSSEVRAAIQQPLDAIVDTVRRTLDSTPPELAADIANRGIVVAGGGAELRGIDRLLSSETGLPVTLADAPLECVVRGAGSSLEETTMFGSMSQRRRSFARRRRRR
jgi:rod shape-determining protein MreB